MTAISRIFIEAPGDDISKKGVPDNAAGTEFRRVAWTTH